jgi:hypothetical protein
MVKAQAEPTQTAAADAAEGAGFMDTTAEQVVTMAVMAAQAVSELAEAQERGRSLRADRAQGAATVMPHYFIKRRKRVWH